MEKEKKKTRPGKNEKGDAKAVRLKRIREGLKKTSKFREEHKDDLYRARQVK